MYTMYLLDLEEFLIDKGIFFNVPIRMRSAKFFCEKLFERFIVTLTDLYH